MENKLKEMFLEHIRQKLEANTFSPNARFSSKQVLAAIKSLEYFAQDVETAAVATMGREDVSSLEEALALVQFTHDAFLFERYAYHWLDSLREITSIYSLELDYSFDKSSN